LELGEDLARRTQRRTASRPTRLFLSERFNRAQVRRLYGPRFFQGISFDAWYAKGPFLRAVEKLGWFWVVVLKREDMEVYQAQPGGA